MLSFRYFCRSERVMQADLPSEARFYRGCNMPECESNFHVVFASCRHSSLQKDKDHIAQEYEKNIQQLQSKYDGDISFLKQEHALSKAKVRDCV